MRGRCYCVFCSVSRLIIDSDHHTHPPHPSTHPFLPLLVTPSNLAGIIPTSSTLNSTIRPQHLQGRAIAPLSGPRRAPPRAAVGAPVLPRGSARSGTDSRYGATKAAHRRRHRHRCNSNISPILPRQLLPLTVLPLTYTSSVLRPPRLASYRRRRAATAALARAGVAVEVAEAEADDTPDHCPRHNYRHSCLSRMRF